MARFLQHQLVLAALVLYFSPLGCALLPQGRRYLGHQHTTEDMYGHAGPESRYQTLRPTVSGDTSTIDHTLECPFSDFTRRRLVASIIALYPITFIPHAAIAVSSRDGNTLSDEIFSTLTYQKILGQGSYKTVYLVASGSSPQPSRWAMAVEKVRSKADAKKALRGIRVAEDVQAVLAKKGECQDCFERVGRWWFQSTPLPDFQPNRHVFPSSSGQDRTQATPSKFLGRSKWLVAFKPVYDMDLKLFAEREPTLYPIGSTPGTGTNNSRVLAGINLNIVDSSALRLAYEACAAGRLMHSCNVVHRDIKGKNIMLHKGGRPVIIDFGFAGFATPRRDKRLCIEEPGKMKGERDYMLSADAALYQGCAEGDTYAMGKTLYEVIFGGVSKSKKSSSSSSDSSSSSSSSSSGMTLDIIKAEEQKFRKLLTSNHAGTQSRFLLSNNGRNTLMLVIRGLCQNNPVSFEVAADYLKQELHMELDVV